MVVRDAKRAAILFFDLYASFFASGEGVSDRSDWSDLLDRWGVG